MSSSRTLEVTVISGEDLRVSRRRLVEKNAYVTIGTDDRRNSQATRVDKSGGGYPAWNEKLLIDLPMHSRYLTAEVRCGGGSRVIGAAKIPVSDFLGGIVPENYLHFLSYRLVDSRGEKNGIVNLSVRVKSGTSAASGGYDGGAGGYGKPWGGVGGGGDQKGFNVGGGTVTGIPVYGR